MRRTEGIYNSNPVHTGIRAWKMPERETDMKSGMKWMGKRLLLGMAASAVIAGGILPVNRMDVYAQYNESEAQENEVPEIIKEKKPDGTPFSVPGNGEMLDDISNDGTKQFITVRTKNNQTFFVVIDRANTVDNVYMLSLIDENDLAEFLRDGDDRDTGLPEVKLPEKTDSEQKQESGDQEKALKEAKPVGSMGMLLAAAGIIGLFAAGYYYLKIYKPGRRGGGNTSAWKQGNTTDEADCEYDDDFDGEDTGYDDDSYEEEDEEDEYGYDEYDTVPDEISFDDADDGNSDQEDEGYEDAESEEEESGSGELDMSNDYYEEEGEEELPKPARRRRKRRR